jgi:hypothetical protein
MSIPSNLVGDLAAYSLILQQLLEIVKLEGKTAAAIELSQKLVSQDIGKIGWKIPADWRTGDPETLKKLDSLFNQLGRDAETLTDLAKNESDPPTLSMLAYSISMTVIRQKRQQFAPVDPGSPPSQTGGGGQAMIRANVGSLTWILLLAGGVLAVVSMCFGLLAGAGVASGNSKMGPADFLGSVACVILPPFLIGAGLFGLGLRRYRRRGFVVLQEHEKVEQPRSTKTVLPEKTTNGTREPGSGFIPTVPLGEPCVICGGMYDSLTGGKSNRIYYGKTVGRSQAGRQITTEYEIAGFKDVFICYNCCLKELLRIGAIGPMFFFLFGMILALISMGVLWFIFLPMFAVSVYLFIDRSNQKKILAGLDEQAAARFLLKHEKKLANLAPELAVKAVKDLVRPLGYDAAMTQGAYLSLTPKK